MGTCILIHTKQGNSPFRAPRISGSYHIHHVTSILYITWLLFWVWGCAVFLIWEKLCNICVNSMCNRGMIIGLFCGPWKGPSGHYLGPEKGHYPCILLDSRVYNHTIWHVRSGDVEYSTCWSALTIIPVARIQQCQQDWYWTRRHQHCLSCTNAARSRKFMMK